MKTQNKMKPKTRKFSSTQKRPKSLRQFGDEMKLKAHLLDVEMKARWEKIESDWDLITSEVKKLVPQAKQAMELSASVGKPLVKGIYDALVRIQEGVQRHHAPSHSEPSEPSAKQA